MVSGSDNDSNKDFLEESENLEITLKFISERLFDDLSAVSKQQAGLKDYNRLMWEEGTHTANYKRMIEINQYMDDYLNIAKISDVYHKRVIKYRTLLKSPYFARIDFFEQDYEKEKIYIGYANAMDEAKAKVYIYDWRAPIASMYYRNETGAASFMSPSGEIKGELMLKRQIKVENSELMYFFDSDVVVRDEMLMDVLGQSSSQKMRSIVETIQREQDIIIRNEKNRLLIVQGVAGSGKTAIALHRIAYLLYESEKTGLKRENMLIISPNDVFSRYIDDVLPTLGEESVPDLTFMEILARMLPGVKSGSREERIELLLSLPAEERKRKAEEISFKLSMDFIKVIDAFTEHFIRKMEFSDVYLDGRVLYSKDDIKKEFLDNKSLLYPDQRLNRIYSRISALAEPVFLKIKEKLFVFVNRNDKRRFEEEEITERLLSRMKTHFYSKLKKNISLDPLAAFSRFCDYDLLKRLSPELSKRPELRQSLLLTGFCLKWGFLRYEDACAALYIKTKLEKITAYDGTKHVVIDEAQDYEPLQYKILGRLFNCNYTVLGDINQSFERKKDMDFYEEAAVCLNRPFELITLENGYRSTVEIIEFANALTSDKKKIMAALPRHGEEPKIISGVNLEEKLKNALSWQSAEKHQAKTIAVITKNEKLAKELFDLAGHTTGLNNKNLSIEAGGIKTGAVNFLPFYLAKGLEFDEVIVALDFDRTREHDDIERNMLYIAATRALHYLSVFDK